ncbi:MAG: spore germination protein [Bacillota bacterium]
MNTNQSTALMDRVSEILASLGDSSDVKSRYLQLTGGHSSACLLYIDGIVDTASIQEHIIEPLLHKPALEEDEFFIPYLIHSVLEIPDVESMKDVDKIIAKLLEGSTILLFEGQEETLAADTSKWEERSQSNPKGQRTIEGPDVGSKLVSFLTEINTNCVNLFAIVEVSLKSVPDNIFGSKKC